MAAPAQRSGENEGGMRSLLHMAFIDLEERDGSITSEEVHVVVPEDFRDFEAYLRRLPDQLAKVSR
jgi:hypothetical protein